MLFWESVKATVKGDSRQEPERSPASIGSGAQAGGFGLGAAHSRRSLPGAWERGDGRPEVSADRRRASTSAALQPLLRYRQRRESSSSSTAKPSTSAPSGAASSTWPAGPGPGKKQSGDEIWALQDAGEVSDREVARVNAPTSLAAKPGPTSPATPSRPRLQATLLSALQLAPRIMRSSSTTPTGQRAGATPEPGEAPLSPAAAPRSTRPPPPPPLDLTLMSTPEPALPGALASPGDSQSSRGRPQTPQAQPQPQPKGRARQVAFNGQPPVGESPRSPRCRPRPPPLQPTAAPTPPAVSTVAPLPLLDEGGAGRKGERRRSQGPRRRVSFSEEEAELYEAFTPYARVYGEHPSDFFFDDSGNMVKDAADTSLDMGSVDVGSCLECIVTCGAGYRNLPHFTARFDDLRTLEFGDRVKVEERSGEWVRDKVGWLPLFINGQPVFDRVRVATPRRRPLSKPRCAVMIGAAGA